MIYQEVTKEKQGDGSTVSPCFFVLDLAERKRRNRPGVSNGNGVTVPLFPFCFTAGGRR